MKSIKQALLSSAIMLALSVVFTSCDDILGEWSRPTPNPIKPVSPADETITVPGLLAGKFSISATKQVRFSQGNLQYQASSGTWRFAENQYDYVGDAAGNTTSTGRDTQADWIDLFGWGTAGHSFTSGYGEFYQPWATDDTDAKKYGPTGTSNGLYDDYVQGDWGTNAISNGGNTANIGWRTLTTGEWAYLFSSRNVNGGTGSGHSYTYGKSVKGKLGIVIYPDGYEGAEYAGDDWATFEAAGCVFLPSAGRRSDKTSVYESGTYGYYWSSSPGSNEMYAHNICFTSSDLALANVYSRCDGLSVRLVYDVE